jgi:hypothetical protein
VAVRCCLCGSPHGNIAAGADDILDVELLSQMLGQLLCDQASDRIECAARREGNDHPDRTGRIGLRHRNLRSESRCKNGTRKGQELTANEAHEVLLTAFDCCARAASGQAAAVPPSSVMNTRLAAANGRGVQGPDIPILKVGLL